MFLLYFFSISGWNFASCMVVAYIISYHSVKDFRNLHDDFDKSFARSMYVVKLYGANVINL